MFTVKLIHTWTKETREFEVSLVTPDYITINWGQSGAYVLNLKSNALTAHSAAARRKNPYALWSAVDITAVRLQVIAHIEERKHRINTHDAMKVHAATMPVNAPHTALRIDGTPITPHTYAKRK